MIKQSDFSARLMDFCRKRIDQLQISKAEVSRQCEVDPHTLEHWLSGDTIPTVSNASRLLNVLGCEFAVRSKA